MPLNPFLKKVHPSSLLNTIAFPLSPSASSFDFCIELQELAGCVLHSTTSASLNYISYDYSVFAVCNSLHKLLGPPDICSPTHKCRPVQRRQITMTWLATLQFFMLVWIEQTSVRPIEFALLMIYIRVTTHLLRKVNMSDPALNCIPPSKESKRRLEFSPLCSKSLSEDNILYPLAKRPNRKSFIEMLDSVTDQVQLLHYNQCLTVLKRDIWVQCSRQGPRPNISCQQGN